MTPYRDISSTPSFNPSRRRPRLCILGGGFGGSYVALNVRLRHWDVVLVDRCDRFVFTPLLYERLTDELQTWEIAPTYRQLLRHTSVQFCQDRVEAIDLDRRRVTLRDRGILDYDALVLALGVVGTRPPDEGVFGFRTLDDAERLDTRLRRLEASGSCPIRVSVIGGGPSGVELACKLADRLGRRGEVRLLDRGDRILPQFTRATRRSVRNALDRRQVRLSLKTNVTEIGNAHLTIEQKTEQNLESTTIPSDLVVWTAGTRSHPLSQTLGCDRDERGRLIVEPTLQLKGRSEVFVLGDMAAIRDRTGRSVPTTAQAAYQQARCVAKNLQAQTKNRPLRRFRYWHLGEMMTLGKHNGVTHSFGIHLDGALGNFVRRLVYLQRLPTLRHSLRVLWHWLTVAISQLSSRYRSPK
ncbi:NADH dehydrogenase [Geitlerinema sp. FC II]|nr:NADH dehydrogenase [Geitlerinema sp. FC II]